MKRVIVDYAKLTNEILNLLVERFPDGYDDSDIVRFRNAKNELIEAVEVRTEDTIYLVKVSMKLADRIENHDEDDEIDDEIEPIIPIKGLDLDDDDDEMTTTTIIVTNQTLMTMMKIQTSLIILMTTTMMMKINFT